jgi:L-asparaginase
VQNDAQENLIAAMIITANFPIPEICLCFGSKLLRGCRSVKVNADGLEAFASPNFPPLDEIGIDIEINRDLLLPTPAEQKLLEVRALSQAKVAALRLFPGISADIVRNILRPPLQGLVMEAYGVGNGPSSDRQFIAALAEATAREVVIVDCTQCLARTVDLGDYSAGSSLVSAGVISGYDLTVEAALAKLVYLFSQNLPVERIKELMQRNLRGELTPAQ